MNDQRIAILTDTGTNVPADFAAAHDVRNVSLVVNYSDGSFRSGVDITTDEVIDRFETEIPTTSLPSPSDIQAALEDARADGYERAVFVTISSGLSATNQTVELVASQMEGFPVTVVDTKSIGVAAGLVVMAATEMVEAGVPFDELGPRLADLSEHTRVYFTVRELKYLRHGGRINEATYRLGSALNIKPVFFCDEQGKYATVKKARGWEKALSAELSFVQEQARRYEKVICAVCCTKAEDRLEELSERIRETIPNVADIVTSGISPDLIVHTGASLVGMAVQPTWR
ncbi:DegV family protein [uncultured Parolsenella sp.]|uniref:DegV family protein n=1 Tax=uncultured Parolsenella sp. TaxID=2083008 RepID=UPI0027DDF8AF|nr:DegV family protein [uncultured Parolsenella sp.]